MVNEIVSPEVKVSGQRGCSAPDRDYFFSPLVPFLEGKRRTPLVPYSGALQPEASIKYANHLRRRLEWSNLELGLLCMYSVLVRNIQVLYLIILNLHQYCPLSDPSYSMSTL
jgi:hypothetical protein